MENTNDVDRRSGGTACSTAFFDKVIVALLDDDGPPPNLSGIDPLEFLKFAAREAYCHIRGRDPGTPEDDELAGRSRAAFFVCEALLAALEHSGDVESAGWREQ